MRMALGRAGRLEGKRRRAHELTYPRPAGMPLQAQCPRTLRVCLAFFLCRLDSLHSEALAPSPGYLFFGQKTAAKELPPPLLAPRPSVWRLEV